MLFVKINRNKLIFIRSQYKTEIYVIISIKKSNCIVLFNFSDLFKFK